TQRAGAIRASFRASARRERVVHGRRAHRTARARRAENAACLGLSALAADRSDAVGFTASPSERRAFRLFRAAAPLRRVRLDVDTACRFEHRRDHRHEPRGLSCGAGLVAGRDGAIRWSDKDPKRGHEKVMGNERTSYRLLRLIGLIFALGIGFPLTHWGEIYVHAGDLWTAELLWWVAVLVLLDYVLAAERRPLSSVGLRAPRGWDIGWGLIFGVALLVGAGVIDSVLLPALHLQINLSTYQTIMGAPLGYRVALVTRAAVCEEILFRGYSIERLK